MDAINQFLASQGPIGIAIGLGVTLLVNYLRTKQVLPAGPGPAAPPVTPPGPDAAPAPPIPVLPVIPNRPLLNTALQLLQLVQQRKATQAANPFAAAAFDQFGALEDEVLKRVAAEVAPPSKV